MTDRPHGAPGFRAPRLSDLAASIRLGLQDFAATPLISLYFAAYFVAAGLGMAWVTYVTAQTFWLILAVLGFPLIGVFAAFGLYEISRRRSQGRPVRFVEIQRLVWSERGGQVPWLAVIVVVILLFWFFLGHMIFALFLGLSPMTHVSTSLTVFWSPEGLAMVGFGSAIGAGFAVLIFAASVLAVPMLLERDVDFMTAMATSMGQVIAHPAIYLLWGAIIAILTFIAMVPAFLGLFLAMPVLGHATWHLYARLSAD